MGKRGRRAASWSLPLLLALGLAGVGGGMAWSEASGGPYPLEKAGWTLITASDDTYVYMKPATKLSGGLRRVWTAYDSERRLNRLGFSFMSVVSLGEFDCRRRVSRVVEETFHDERSLKGRSWQAPNFIPTPWAAPAPDSVGAIRMAFACRALNDT